MTDTELERRTRLAFACIGAAVRGDGEGLDLLIANTADPGDLRRLARSLAEIAATEISLHVDCHANEEHDLPTNADRMDRVLLLQRVTLAEVRKRHDRG